MIDVRKSFNENTAIIKGNTWLFDDHYLLGSSYISIHTYPSMLSSTALRLTRSAGAPPLPSLSTFASATTKAGAPSLCRLFDASLRLSSAEPSSQTIVTMRRQYPRRMQLEKLAMESTLGVRYFSSKSDEPANAAESAASKTNTGNRQHETWVEFQVSIR